MWRFIRGSLAALIALTTAQAAQAQEGIWIRCERAPGAPTSDRGDSFVGPLFFGNGTFRIYREANRSFDVVDYCTTRPGVTAQCTLTDDEFTFDNRFVNGSPGRPYHYENTFRGRINRRTGNALFTVDSINDPGMGNHRFERVCRSIADPRPPRAF